MPRSRRSAKKAGEWMERATADWLAARLNDDRIDRRVKAGNKDRGDIAGVRTMLGDRVVIECKDYGGQVKVAEWLAEAHVEAANDDAVAGIVVVKRRGIGAQRMGEQLVMMTLQDLTTILAGKVD